MMQDFFSATPNSPLVFWARSVCSGWAWPEILKASAKMSLMKRGGSSCQFWSEWNKSRKTWSILKHLETLTIITSILLSTACFILACNCKKLAVPVKCHARFLLVLVLLILITLASTTTKWARGFLTPADRKIYEDLSFAMILHSTLVEKYAAQESVSEPKN